MNILNVHNNKYKRGEKISVRNTGECVKITRVNHRDRDYHKNH